MDVDGAPAVHPKWAILRYLIIYHLNGSQKCFWLFSKVLHNLALLVILSI
jgi:hypothetical protein